MVKTRFRGNEKLISRKKPRKDSQAEDWDDDGPEDSLELLRKSF